jgi:predicted NUDIX family NTP pyrophosphohydrolase
MEVVRVLRKAAFDWEWLDRVPKVRMLPESKRCIRWITKDEAERLMAALPDHLAAMVRKCAHFSSYVDRLSGLQAVGNGEIATFGLRATK